MYVFIYDMFSFIIHYVMCIIMQHGLGSGPGAGIMVIRSFLLPLSLPLPLPLPLPYPYPYPYSIYYYAAWSGLGLGRQHHGNHYIIACCLFVRTVSNFKFPGSRPQKQI